METTTVRNQQAPATAAALASVKPEKKSVDLHLIPPMGDAQTRVRMDSGVVDEYVGYVESGSPKLPRIDVFGPDERGVYHVGDGFHRLAAHRQTGSVTIDCNVRPGGATEALLWALQANETHGLRRTDADRRNAIKIALLKGGMASRTDNDIAKNVIRCNHITVGRVRRELIEQGLLEPPETEERTDAKGRDITPPANSEEISRMRAEADKEARWRRAMEKEDPAFFEDFEVEGFRHVHGELIDGDTPTAVPVDCVEVFAHPFAEDLRPEVSAEIVTCWRDMLAGRPGKVPVTVLMHPSGNVEVIAKRDLVIDALQSIDPKIEIFRKKPCSPRHAEKAQVRAERDRVEKERREWLREIVRRAVPAYAEACALRKDQGESVEAPDAMLWLALSTFSLHSCHLSGLAWLADEYAPEIEAALSGLTEDSEVGGVRVGDMTECDHLVLVARQLGDRDRLALHIGALLATHLRSDGTDAEMIRSAAEFFNCPLGA